MPAHSGPVGYPEPYATAPRGPKNGFGTASLVLGIVGLPFAFIPIIGVIAWPLVILGLIFGLVGMSRARKGTADNRGVAIAGAICSAIGLLVCVLWVAGISATDPVPTPSPSIGVQSSIQPVPSAVPSGSYSDGKYEVGVEIAPGTYKTDGPGQGAFPCTWTKYKDATGDFNSITSSDIVEGRDTVTIRSGGYMEFTGGCVWIKQ